MLVYGILKGVLYKLRPNATYIRVFTASGTQRNWAYAKGEWGVFEGANDSHSSDTFIFIK